MNELEIGRAKRGRRAYSLDDVAIVPSRRTRDPEDVSTAWQIDAYRFELPLLAAPMDSVMSPETAIAFGRHGGLPVLDLEGLWTRYEDPAPLLAEKRAPARTATRGTRIDHTVSWRERRQRVLGVWFATGSPPGSWPSTGDSAGDSNAGVPDGAAARSRCTPAGVRSPESCAMPLR